MFTVIINGLEVRCADEYEVIRLTRAAGTTEFAGKNGNSNDSGERRKPGRPPSKNGQSAHEIADRLAGPIKILKSIQAAGAVGINGEAICSLMNLTQPRSVGGTMVGVRSVLRNSGFEPDDVFLKRGKPKAVRWVPMSLISDAVKKLEAQGGAK